MQIYFYNSFLTQVYSNVFYVKKMFISAFLIYEWVFFYFSVI